MPSSSARCAQLPRAADKVPYYAALKKFRDYLNGTISHLDESDIVFADSKLKKKEQEAIEDKKPAFCEELTNEGESRITEANGTGMKQDSNSQIPGKKKRGRPKKIKNPEDQPPPDPEKLDANGEVIKKRRGRPKKIHQQQKQQEREMREQQQQHQQQHQSMGHLGDGYGGVVPNCFSPPKTFAHMAPYPQPMNDSGFYGQGINDSPYSINAKQSPVHLQHYSQSPKSMSLSFTHSDLSSEINTAISSENNLEPSPLTSPSVEHPDFEPPTSISQQNMNNDHRQYNPAGNGENPGHHGSPGTPSHQSYTSYMGYHDQTSDPHNPHPHQTTPTPLSQTTDDHSHHSHPTPPHTHPHTPTHASMSPHHHPHEQYAMKRNAGQDVASKSLSDLESLVDQIPSIADGGSQRLQHAHPGMTDDGSLAEKMEAHHQSYLSGFSGMPNAGMSNYSPPLAPAGAIYPSSLHHSPNDGYGSLYGMNGRQHQDSQQQQQQQQQQHQQQQQQHSKSYTVENLASSNYTPSMSHGHPGNSYPNIIPGPHYPVPMGSTNGYLFGGLESSLMQRTYGMSGMSGMGGMHPSLGHMANPYSYNGSYSSSFDAYPAPPAGIHAPSANYPGGYASVGSATPGTSTPPSYLPSHHRPSVDLAYDGV